MTFTTLLTQIKATYPQEPHKFHVIATRYYLGAETRETLKLLGPEARRPYLTAEQIQEIINNR